MTELLPYALPLAVGLAGLLLAPAVDRWAERFDAWVDGRLRIDKKTEPFKSVP